MKKICLVVVGLYIGLLAAFSQTADSLPYKKRKLATDEVNLLTSYYAQDGNNSAITGGTGTEKLKDYSLNIELKLHKYDKQGRKRSWNVNAGLDYYTSASSDKIDPATISSASSEDFRFYPSIEHVVENEKKGKKINFSSSFSVETDYMSFGLGAGLSKLSKDKNREFTAKVQCYFDRVMIILPYEFRTTESGGLTGATNQHDYPWKNRTTYGIFFSYSQVINQRLQLIFLLDPAYQHGLLSMPFHRIFFKDESFTTELLPSSRFKMPIGVRANYFAGDNIILRSFYRFYTDDWGLTAHTADIETVFKINPFFSVSPFYRFYTQTAIKYFAPYKQHNTREKYYSSNYDLSAFKSHFLGMGFRLTPVKQIIGINQFELRYGHYTRTNKLHSDVISLYLKLK